jgi:hypothetical protein
MLSVRLVLLILAIVCFGLSAAGVPTPRVNLLALGLFFWALALVATGTGSS